MTRPDLASHNRSTDAPTHKWNLMLYALIAYYSDGSAARVVALYDKLEDVQRALATLRTVGTIESVTVVSGAAGVPIKPEDGNCFKDRSV